MTTAQIQLRVDQGRNFLHEALEKNDENSEAIKRVFSHFDSTYETVLSDKKCLVDFARQDTKSWTISKVITKKENVSIPGNNGNVYIQEKVIVVSAKIIPKVNNPLTKQKPSDDEIWQYLAYCRTAQQLVYEIAANTQNPIAPQAEIEQNKQNLFNLLFFLLNKIEKGTKTNKFSPEKFRVVVLKASMGSVLSVSQIKAKKKKTTEPTLDKETRETIASVTAFEASAAARAGATAQVTNTIKKAVPTTKISALPPPQPILPILPNEPVAQTAGAVANPQTNTKTSTPSTNTSGPTSNGTAANARVNNISSLPATPPEPILPIPPTSRVAPQTSANAAVAQSRQPSTSLFGGCLRGLERLCARIAKAFRRLFSC